MLLKVRRGAFNPTAGDVEPAGDELWSGGDNNLSAAALATPDSDLEVGTWYKLEDFRALLENRPAPGEAAVRGAITVQQPGVAKPWEAVIEVEEASAALMICRSVIDLVDQLNGSTGLWVRVE